MEVQQKNVGIWIRVSTDDQAKGESPEHHEQRARMYAELKGWRVLEVYDLAGVSGKTVIEHPEAQRMLQDVKSGKIQALIFSKLARLARNTKELLQLAEFFKNHDADLVSIEMNIDTSNPAGRLLFTVIAGLTEWEREEISARVKASVKTRAKMGKSTGGIPPYGYKWVNKKLQLDLKEAPVRKKMFELFDEHKRVKVVVKKINEMGYRTRKGKPFAPTTVKRLLMDTIAKGIRRVNYTYSIGKHKHAQIKDESEWIFVEVPQIVSVELWERCNEILKEDYREKKRTKQVKRIFSGYMFCGCGSKMYVTYNHKINYKKYVCLKCRNKISMDDAEAIFKEYLQDFLFNEEEIKKEIERFEGEITQQEKDLERMKSELEKLNIKLSNIMELFQEGQIMKKAFAKHYNPVFEQAEQKEVAIARLETEIQIQKGQILSSDALINDAKNLHTMWDNLSFEEKRSIIENVLYSYTVKDDKIEIIFNHLPTSPTTHPSSELLKKGTTPSRIHTSNQNKTSWVIHRYSSS